jgi:hypothetical protein
LETGQTVEALSEDSLSHICPFLTAYNDLPWFGLVSPYVLDSLNLKKKKKKTTLDKQMATLQNIVEKQHIE